MNTAQIGVVTVTYSPANKVVRNAASYIGRVSSRSFSLWVDIDNKIYFNELKL